MSTDVLMEKWAPVISHDSLPDITDRDKKAVVAQVLENTERALSEEAGQIDEASLSGAQFGGGWSGSNTNGTLNATGRVGYDPIIISLVRRAMPQMMAFDLCGVQPMSAPTGLIFALRARYQDTNVGVSGTEAFYNEAFPNFSGTAFNQRNAATAAAPEGTFPQTHGAANPAGSKINPNPFAVNGSDNMATARVKVAEADGTMTGAQAAAQNYVDANGAAFSGTTPLTSGTDLYVNYSNNPFSNASGNNPALNATFNPKMAGETGYAPNGQSLTSSDERFGLTPYGMTTREGEGDNFREMSFTIERTAVEAKTRALKSEYTMELVQDLKAVHGLDAEAELANILSTEILAEINREVVHTLISQAKYGCQGLTTNGVFDLISDGQGRWSVERQKGLMLQFEKEANEIAFETRRGKGNFLLCSANVASALTMAGLLDYSSGLSDNLNVDVTSGVFAGTLNGRMKVYVDPYATSGDYAVVGYKGSNNMDAGMFYCPYVPLQMVRAVAQETFQPKIGFKTRYGMVSNPFAGGSEAHKHNFGLLNANTNVYYRKFRIDNV